MSLSSEIKVGLFTVVGIGVLTTTAFVLGGNPFNTKKQHFHTLLNNVGGVGERTQVRASGVKVGEVTSVDIMPEGARVNFDIDGDVKIPQGSYIEIRSRGILGDVYIEVIRNTKELNSHKSGDMLPRNSGGNDMDSLMSNLNEISRDIKKISQSLANALGTKEGETSVKNIVENIETFTKDLREISESQKKNLKETIEALHDSSLRVAKLIENNDAKIDQIVSDVKTFSTLLRQVSTPENREKIESIITSVEEASSSIRRISARIENGEGTIGQLIAKDETAEEVRATLKSIQEVVKPIAQLKLTVQDRAEYRVANAHEGDKFANEFNLIFSTRPDRFYLLGLTNSAYGRKVTNTSTTTTTLGNTTVTNTQENTPEEVGSIRYNLQISQRFGFLGLRLGLFASSGGLASDFYAFNDRLVGTFELTNFNGKPIPTDTQYGARGPFNLKAYANFFITPNLFVTGGVDGVVLNPKPFPFVGAGISISDDDIKGLIGVAAIAK